MCAAETGSYELEEDRVLHWVVSRGYRRVLLQAPDGIKAYLRGAAALLEDEGVEVVVSASHAWGGCDVALCELGSLGCDAVVHIGHHGPVRFEPPPNVLFIPGRSKLSVDEVAEQASTVLISEGIRRVGVLASIQHVHRLSRVTAILRSYGIDALSAKSPDPWMVEGLVIGCDNRAAKELASKVEAFLVISGGRFHALGVALATGVRTFAADPYLRAVVDVSGEAKRVVALRLAHISSLYEARNMVVVASVKPGQRLGWDKLNSLIRLLKKKGVRVAVAVVDDVSREALTNLGGADLYVNTACPRLATDDPHIFPAPVLNAKELLQVLEHGLASYSPEISVAPA